MTSDVDWMRPRAHIHRHKLHKHNLKFSVQGNNKVCHIWQQLEPLIVHQEDDLILVGGSTASESDGDFKPKPIFSEAPHITWDNLFSGDRSLIVQQKKALP